ncbi:hypothetical protein [Streptomyces litchfieldiae]|uniref:RCK C-terminal domain-containing protein n=1 Tax=Streptomyces litchfieldiae TaxID=3075543 RepID=A0ABU2MMU6_9ACTN|nr:hypothetical protein [Streptomyces sp. DSM 44938]MDT0341979.1 hypothetical protein [Streptomyces sp. DSM 44938]
MDCELALRGEVPPGALEELSRELYDAGAATRVAPQWVGPPPPGRRAGDFVEQATLAMSTAGSLVAIVDVVRRWLIEGRARRAAQHPAPSSVEIRIGDSVLVITEPSTDAELRALDEFLRRHDGREPDA